MMLTSENDFTGVFIPAELYLNKELSWTEKFLIIEIDRLDRTDAKGCFAGNAHFAESLQISEGQVRNIISGLYKKQWVAQLWFDGRNRGLRTRFGGGLAGRQPSAFPYSSCKEAPSAVSISLQQDTGKPDHNLSVNAKEEEPSLRDAVKTAKPPESLPTVKSAALQEKATRFWRDFTDLLIKFGTKEDRARSALGGLKKTYGDVLMYETFEENAGLLELKGAGAYQYFVAILKNKKRELDDAAAQRAVNLTNEELYQKQVKEREAFFNQFSEPQHA